MTRLLGLDFAPLDTDGALALLDGRPADGPFGYLVTPNADHLVRLARDPTVYGPLYRDASWRVLDSRVVARVARLVGLRAPPVVPGSDLTARLFAEVIRPDDPIVMVGGTRRTGQAIAERFDLRGLRQHVPPMGFDADPEAFETAVRFVEEAAPRFSFIGVGSPRQEILARALAARGRARGTALCVGASLLFLSGEERRAPRAVQGVGLEWAWRLAQDPRRLARRYLLEDPAIIALLLRERSARLTAGGR